MGITAVSGPFLGFGITQTSSGLVGEYNEERGPSLFDLGDAIMDPRPQFNYKPGNPPGTQIKGFFTRAPVVDCQPFTMNASAIVGSTSNAPVAGTALTLVPLSSFGAIQTTITAPETGLSVSVIALDSTAACYLYGQSGTIAIWNPQAVPGRTISVINSSNANTELYYVNGRDQYGFKMTELIAASTTSTGTGIGLKAFKYITSVIPATNTTISATGVKVGFRDTFGFPFKTDYFAATTLTVSSLPMVPTLMVLSSANAVPASTAATQTSTTPDVRGTFTSTIATNGSTLTGVGASSLGSQSSAVRVTLTQAISPYMVNTVTASDQTYIFGPTQYSNF
jgi:hypothetical protein